MFPNHPLFLRHDDRNDEIGDQPHKARSEQEACSHPDQPDNGGVPVEILRDPRAHAADHPVGIRSGQPSAGTVSIVSVITIRAITVSVLPALTALTAVPAISVVPALSIVLTRAV